MALSRSWLPAGGAADPGEYPNPEPDGPGLPDDDRLAFMLFLILLLLVLIF